MATKTNTHCGNQGVFTCAPVGVEEARGVLYLERLSGAFLPFPSSSLPIYIVGSLGQGLSVIMSLILHPEAMCFFAIDFKENSGSCLEGLTQVGWTLR